MMAALFAVFALSMATTFYNNRKATIGLVVAGLLLTLIMFWHHATSVLEINW